MHFYLAKEMLHKQKQHIFTPLNKYSIPHKEHCSLQLRIVSNLYRVTSCNSHCCCIAWWHAQCKVYVICSEPKQQGSHMVEHSRRWSTDRNTLDPFPVWLLVLFGGCIHSDLQLLSDFSWPPEADNKCGVVIRTLRCWVISHPLSWPVCIFTEL